MIIMVQHCRTCSRINLTITSVSIPFVCSFVCLLVGWLVGWFVYGQVMLLTAWSVGPLVPQCVTHVCCTNWYWPCLLQHTCVCIYRCTCCVTIALKLID